MQKFRIRIQNLSVLILAMFGLVLLGCQQEFQANKSSSPFNQADFGELPPTPDGSVITSFSSLVDDYGRAPQGKVLGQSTESTNTFSVGLASGDLVNLIAKVGTSSNKSYFIANSNGFEGYIEQHLVDIQDIDEGGEGSNPGPVDPGKCKAGISTSYGDYGVPGGIPQGRVPTGTFPGGIAMPTFLPGDMFRSASPNMALIVETSGHVSQIKVKVTGEGDDGQVSMPAKTFTVDANETNHSFKFSQILEKNDWAAMRARDNYTHVSKVTFAVYLNDSGSAILAAPPGEFPPHPEEPESPTPGNCGIEGEISSPLVMDFSGHQQFKTVAPMEKMVSFDIDNDGKKDSMGWIAPQTGLLALDLNRNGKIDNGSELFGEATRLGNGQLAANGYLALKHYLPKAEDLHECTSVLDQRAPIFKRLRVWFDVNQDGISQKTELKTMAEAGVTGIDTNYSNVPLAEQSRGLFDNVVKYQSKFWGPSQCGVDGCHTYDVYFSTFKESDTLTSR